MSILLDKISA